MLVTDRSSAIRSSVIYLDPPLPLFLFFIPIKPMHLRMPIDIEREEDVYRETRIYRETDTGGTCVFVRVGVCVYVGMCV